MIISMLLVATISLNSLSAMEKKFDEKDFYEMKTCNQLIKNEVFKDSQKLCALCHRFSQNYVGYEVGPIKDLKQIIVQNKIHLSEIRNESGRTVLHNACFMQGRYQAALPILLELVDDEELFKLLTAQDNLQSTVLHYAATSGLDIALAAFIKAADRYAKGCPEKTRKIFEWLEVKSVFGITAINMAKQSYLFLKNKGSEVCIKILEDALNKYRPINDQES